MTWNRPACNLGTALFPRGDDSVSGRPHHEALRLLYERDSILPLELSGLMWHRPSVANSVAVVRRVALAPTVNASVAWDGRTPHGAADSKAQVLRPWPRDRSTTSAAKPRTEHQEGIAKIT